jgi:AraC-like DNA-binding protein
MMSSPDRFYRFIPPYRRLHRIAGPQEVPDADSTSGSVLIWCMGKGFEAFVSGAVGRPPGVALALVLPPIRLNVDQGSLLEVAEATRPTCILPYHPQPVAEDIVTLLRHPPDDLPGEVTDFLTWRGLVLSSEGKQLLRHTLGASEDLRSVSGLARSLHLSRRALGRRFAESGLPVPSHCLHFGRLLQCHVRAQASAESFAQVALCCGYPDGFSMSNQMNRMLGLRPTVATGRLGWEWMVELWIRREGVMSVASERGVP